MCWFTFVKHWEFLKKIDIFKNIEIFCLEFLFRSNHATRLFQKRNTEARMSRDAVSRINFRNIKKMYTLLLKSIKYKIIWCNGFLSQNSQRTFTPHWLIVTAGMSIGIYIEYSHITCLLGCAQRLMFHIIYWRWF